MKQRLVLVAVIVGAALFSTVQVVQMWKEHAHTQPPSASTPTTTFEPASETHSEPTSAPPPHVDPAVVTPPKGLLTTDQPYDPDEARRITVEELKQRLDKHQKIVFVDTRATVEGTIVKGALFGNEQSADSLAKRIPKSAFVVAYCSCTHEATSAKLVVALQHRGYRNAFALLDGLVAYESLGLPTDLYFPPQ